MKLNFNFNLSAESGKITTDGLTAEIGQISCPINVTMELEASEIQQAIGLMKELVAKVKQHQDGELNLAEKKAKLEADNIRLRAELADNASKTAHVRAIDLMRLKSELENHDTTAEPNPAVVTAEPRINRDSKGKFTK